MFWSREPGVPVAQTPDAWRVTAIHLRRSANLVWEAWSTAFFKAGTGKSVTSQELGDIALLTPFLLLTGLAFENLLKGLIIQGSPHEFDSQLKWPASKGGHDLVVLCSLAKIRLSRQRRHFFDTLSEAILWSGRYPTQKKHGNTQHWTSSIGPKLGKSNNLRDVVQYFRRYKRYIDHQFKAIHGRYRSPPRRPRPAA